MAVIYHLNRVEAFSGSMRMTGTEIRKFPVDRHPSPPLSGRVHKYAIVQPLCAIGH